MSWFRALLLGFCFAPAWAIAAQADILYLDPVGNPDAYGIELFRKVYDAHVRPRHPAATYEHRRIDAETPEAIAAALAPERIRPPKLIFTAQGRTAQVVVRELPGVPLVFFTQGDPMWLGVSDDPIAPRINVTGYTSYSPVELKDIELLQECVPAIRRVGVIADSVWAGGAAPRRLLAGSRALFGLEIGVTLVETPEQVAELPRIQARERYDAWFIPDVPHNRLYYREITAQLRAIGKPYIAGARYPEALLVYMPERFDEWARLAQLINLVLSGVPARDIPFDRPKRFRLTVNQKVARTLGIRVPRSILLRAHELID